MPFVPLWSCQFCRPLFFQKIYEALERQKSFRYCYKRCRNLQKSTTNYPLLKLPGNFRGNFPPNRYFWPPLLLPASIWREKNKTNFGALICFDLGFHSRGVKKQWPQLMQGSEASTKWKWPWPTSFLLQRYAQFKRNIFGVEIFLQPLSFMIGIFCALPSSRQKKIASSRWLFNNCHQR